MKKFLPKTKYSPQGFTLIELMVVISIIAILSVIGLTIFSGVQKNARDAKRKADLKAIATALEIYKTKSSTNTYPATGTWVFSDSASDPWIPGLDSNYMISVPRDPKNSGGPPYYGIGFTYAYYTSGSYGGPNGSWFMLTAQLESPGVADDATQCIAPNGTSVFNYTRNFMVCNQQ